MAETRVSRLSFVTNGVLLTQNNVDRLVRAPLAWLNISVDAADEATHRRIRGNDMTRTIAGIRRLVTAVEGLPIPERPELLQMSMVLMRENIDEVPAFIRLVHSLGVKTAYFQHLVDPQLNPEQWNVQRGNFNFNYAEQRLFSIADHCDQRLIEAMDVADELGVQITGPEFLLKPDNMHHNNRPCRAMAMADLGKEDRFAD